jgi:DNA-directed RNA polymerase delta subunit
MAFIRIGEGGWVGLRLWAKCDETDEGKVVEPHDEARDKLDGLGDCRDCCKDREELSDRQTVSVHTNSLREDTPVRM